DVIKNDRDEGYTKEFMKQFAQKYYSVVAANPDMEANVFKSQASQDALGLIDKVNAFKNKDGKMMLVATIADEKQHPVEISQSQWQRLWLADDKQDYKTHLAATLYADKLQAALEQGAVKRMQDKPLEKMETAKLLRGDNNEWVLYMKPEAKEGFAVEPSESDLKRFFSALKKGGEIKGDDLLKDMAAKYYPQVVADPSMKRDLFYGDVPTEDKSRIDHASIFRTNDDKFMLSASVEGEGKQQPREITQSQWQRLWFAPDMYEYKRRLSAIVFADVLHKEQSQAQSQPQSQEKVPLQSAKRGANSLDLESFKSIKAKHPDALLLFRINDTYRSYMKDAEICSKVLGVDMAKQIDGKTGERVPVAEFPHFELDAYLPKL
ncbi:MAG: hypothetical protein HUJ83_11540, partial [Veillonella sp.]|nr:hypothetical protein [Veillonella sp.]